MTPKINIDSKWNFWIKNKWIVKVNFEQTNLLCLYNISISQKVNTLPSLHYFLEYTLVFHFPRKKTLNFIYTNFCFIFTFCVYCRRSHYWAKKAAITSFFHFINSHFIWEVIHTITILYTCWFTVVV